MKRRRKRSDSVGATCIVVLAHSDRWVFSLFPLVFSSRSSPPSSLSLFQFASCPSVQFSSCLFLFLFSQPLLFTPSPFPYSLSVISLLMTTWQMMSESIWDICMRVSPSVCSVFVLVHVCICVCWIHSALCAECFFPCVHQYFCERVEFCKNICAGGTGSQQSSWRTHLHRSTKIHTEMQMLVSWKNMQIFWGHLTEKTWRGVLLRHARACIFFAC